MSGAAGATVLAHDRSGEGKPLVLIHGVGSRRQVWAPVLPPLVASRTVISVDLPGFGESPADNTPTTVEGYSDRLQRFFDEVEVERPHVGGNSLGGAIALELARREAVRSATCFSPAGFWSPKEIVWAQRRLGQGLQGARVLRPLMPMLAPLPPAKVLFGWYLFGRPWQQPAHEFVNTVEAAVGAANFEPTLAGFTEHRFRNPDELKDARVLIAWGSRDYLLPTGRQAPRAERMLPYARHVRMPGCGHTPFYDDPALCAALLLEGSAPEGG